MKKDILMSLVLALVLTACDKPNPTPEALDPIYEDMIKTAEEAKKDLEKEKAGQEGLEKDLHNAKPQTGERLMAQRHLRESNERLTRIEQMQKYWEIRAETRKDYDRKAYLKARREKTAWPDPQEFKDYSLAQKALQQKRGWDVKARMIEAGVGPKPKAAKKEGEEGGEKKE